MTLLLADDLPMRILAERSWLKSTGQSWKLLIGVLMLLPSPFPIFVRMETWDGWMSKWDFSLSWGVMILLVLAMGICGLLLIVAGIRCPACQGRPVWHIFRTADHKETTYEVVGFTECPICGDDPNSTSTSAP